MPKYSQYAEILETRIRRGDYSLQELPTEQELADEVGASRMTARRALLELIHKGVVVRKPYGRLMVNSPIGRAKRLRLALLTPTFASGQYDKWNHATERVAYANQAEMQSVNYAHWDDPIIVRALSRFDGVFLVRSSEPIPDRIRKLFSQSRNLISLDADLSDWGIPSLRMMRPEFIHQLGDHLLRLGHRRIDLLNVQPGGGILDELIEQWKVWKTLNQVEGEIHNEPVKPNTEPIPGAHKVMSRILGRGRFDATAVLCLTGAVMTGAIRALHEHGLVTGRDISICAVESGGEMTRYETPSRTALITPSPDKYVDMCVKWLAGRTGEWEGPLLLQPPAAQLYKGESTISVNSESVD